MTITLTPKTDQEAFDLVVRHLATMPGRANESGSCLYRTPTGNRCAIGAMIPDDQYVEDIEGTSLRGLISDEQVNIGPLTEDLLSELQCVHDEGDYWHNTGFFHWPILRDLADQYGLSTAVLDEVLPKVPA